MKIVLIILLVIETICLGLSLYYTRKAEKLRLQEKINELHIK